MNAWTTAEADALEKCGHCDNCTRPPESITTKDVTLAAWQLVKIVTEAHRLRAKLTLIQLRDAARAKGGGKINGPKTGRGSRATQEKLVLDYETLCGGQVDLSDDVRPDSLMLRTGTDQSIGD